MASEQLGNIVYEVEMDVGKLLAAQQKVNERLDKMDDNFTQSAKSASKLEGSMTTLASAIKLVMAATALRGLADMVQRYQEMAERVQMATTSQIEFEHVQKRLLKTANGTFRSLSEAQELYITTAASLRSMNYTTDQTIDIQDSMSYAFVKNATSADRASGAISAFSKSMNKGRVEANSWETIIAAIPSVIEDIAAASGKSSAQIRELGSSGKITANQLSEGLRQSLEANSTAATGMANNLTDASVRMKTAITSVLVAMEEQTGALQAFTNGIISAADSILGFSQDTEKMPKVMDALSVSVGVVAAVIASRYVGALSMATTAQVSKMIATRQATVADSLAAQTAAKNAASTLIAAQAAKTRALEEIKLAEMQAKSAFNATNAAAAESRLSVARGEAAIATQAYNKALASNVAAQGQAAAAAKAASVAGGLLRGALSLVGGPAGVAMLAASAVFYFSEKAKQAKQEANDLADSVSTLVDKFKTMDSVKLSSELSKLSMSLPSLQESLSDARKEFDNANYAVAKQTKTIKDYGLNTKFGRQASEALAIAQDRLNIAASNLADAQGRVNQTQGALNIGRAILNGTLKEGIDLLRRDGQEAGVAATMMNQLGQAINFAAGEKEKFNSSSLGIERDSKQQAVLDDLYEQNELLSETNLRKREQLKVENDLRKMGADENTIRIARENAGAIYDKMQAEREGKKETQASAKVESQAAAEEKNRVKQLQSLKDAIAVAALETHGLNREAAILEATQKLGASATQAQIASVSALAGQEFDIQQRAKDKKAALDADSVANANKLRKEELEQLERQLKAGDFAIDNGYQRRLEIAAKYSKSIAEAEASKVVTPQQENAAMVDPVQALANENARKLALIKQFETDKTLTIDQAEALRNATATQYEQQRKDAIWTIWSQQNEVNGFLASSLDALASRSTNAITGLITGSQTAAEAMANLAATIAQEAVGALVKMGLQAVKNMVIGQAAATAATTATIAQALAVGSAWATPAALASLATSGANAAPAAAGITSVVGTANSMAVAGARKNGGPVSAGSMYRVGEGGKPEIYQASGGKQYMIPGDNGKVISNRDIQSGGGGGISLTVESTFNIETGGGDFTEQDAKIITNMVKSQVYDIIANMRRPGGELSNG